MRKSGLTSLFLRTKNQLIWKTWWQTLFQQEVPHSTVYNTYNICLFGNYITTPKIDPIILDLNQGLKFKLLKITSPQPRRQSLHLNPKYLFLLLAGWGWGCFAKLFPTWLDFLYQRSHISYTHDCVTLWFVLLRVTFSVKVCPISGRVTTLLRKISLKDER